MTIQPDWIKNGIEKGRLDAREMIRRGEHPKDFVLNSLQQLKPGEFFVLIAPFVPEPLIAIARNLGFQTHTVQKDVDEVITYFGLIQENLNHSLK